MGSTNSIQERLEHALAIEKQGYKQDALHSLVNLVREYPECKACRFHMGRVSVDIKKESV